MKRDWQTSQHLFVKEQGQGSTPLAEDSHESACLGSAMKPGQDGDLGAHAHLGAANLTRAFLILKPWE